MSDQDWLSISKEMARGNEKAAYGMLSEISENDPEAQYMLGMLTYNGVGTQTNIRVAHSLFMKSLKGNMLESGFAICKLIFTNKNSEFHSYKRAAACFEDLSVKGHAGAKELLSIFILFDYSPEILKKYTKRDASNLMIEAFNSGSSSAAYFLYLKSREQKDIKEPVSRDEIRYLELAAKDQWDQRTIYGDKSFQNIALKTLADLYLSGNGLQKSPEKYAKYLYEAARLEDVDAMCFYGRALGKGFGVKQDFTKARDYLNRAKELGCSYADRLLDSLKQDMQTINRMDNYIYIVPPSIRKSYSRGSSKKSFGKVLAGVLLCAAAPNTGSQAACMESFATGITGGARSSNDYDWDWDFQPGNQQWVCRGVQTGQYAEVANCRYDSKTDYRWPSN